ncbi:CZB domain-containing protein [Rhodovulum marinum]|uniref:Chemoreceptor zinc-binding protein n=1 Tax=Rhodovulum marinum TaxID=320662 RepID=A0A4R2Q1E5_9RHOB|nr:CZB domain-containing protein [Rhodovulum marinum]TCP40435.1 chemoreceptor zinc-binding protein [Rhodovulum marinum]
MTDWDALIPGIDAALKKHMAWKSALLSALHSGTSEMSPYEAACDHACDFGRWFHGPDIPDAVRILPIYRRVAQLHAEFHANAAKVLLHATGGRKTEAREVLNGPFEAASAALMRALQDWKHDLSTAPRTGAALSPAAPPVAAAPAAPAMPPGHPPV